MSADGEEVEDYMSDTFVTKDDVRPSLLFSHRLKVRHESMKKKLSSNPKPKSYYNELEKQLREEALNKPLDSTNKGFKLLSKMGFSGYQSTSSDQNNSGTDSQTSGIRKPMISEPIKIEIKTDRKGLGTEPKRQTTVRKANPLDDKLSEEQYRSHKKSKNNMFLIKKDLKTAQNICRNLDIDSGFDQKEFINSKVRPKWFWPPIDDKESDNNDIIEEHQKEEEEEEEEEEETEELLEYRLKTVNKYLREEYFFCIWCGIRFNDIQDLKDNCLGDTRDDHQ